ncbi:MAG: DUF6599 family protein [Bacteroidales bacterium]
MLALTLLTPLSSMYGQTGMKALLPVEGEIKGWEVAGPVRQYGAEQLESIAGRESVLYSEYGFREAIRASMINSSGEILGLEIYRMDDTFGSYALYLQKSRGAGETYTAGNNSYLDSLSLGFWKHHYLVTISCDRLNDSTLLGMKLVADLVDSRIRPNGKLPEITAPFMQRPGRVTLLRGKTGLSYIYHFTTTDVFRIDEGIAIEETGRAEIWLKYPNPDMSVQRLGEVAGVLSRDQRFTGFMMSGDQSFRLSDRLGNTIDIEATGRYLKILIAASTTISY